VAAPLPIEQDGTVRRGAWTGGVMEYRDKVLKCVECGAEFVFTSGEQLFYAEKGFRNEPKRCRNCKGTRSQPTGEGHSGYQRERVVTTTVCSQCGKETTVPFRLTQGRPVYCRECYQQRRAAAASS
jgi:CxxC-x17-CxxC domain-containing protein